MDINYIIVQAGGKGTRLEHLTKNKPKALVPIENLPMIFHLFRKFPDRKFIVIGDYQRDVFRKYLRCFSDVDYLFVEADGAGTCAGLGQALRYVPQDAAFMYVWSDLVLADSFELPREAGNYIGISHDFECRWSYVNGEYTEKPSCADGVAGLFIFESKDMVSDAPQSGEFVKYLQEKEMPLTRLELCGTREFGLLSEYNKLQVEKCRPFNSMSIEGDVLTKRGIDEQGRKLAVREVAWYKKAAELGYEKTPKIYEYEPLTMQRIDGFNIYETDKLGLTEDEKNTVLEKLVSNLQELHGLQSVPCDYFSIYDAYVGKTFDRLERVRDLIPLADQKHIIINGKKCRNVFFFEAELERQVMAYDYKDFKFIHGDCTFSNMMLDKNLEPVLIDPRGYFGRTELYGDEDYDWAKLYYSLKGNYDQFNLKRFRLEIGDGGVNLSIESNGFENIADRLFELVPGLDAEKIKLIHAIIWLSLTTYAWQDYDSICGAFYNGCYYLEEALHDKTF